ncbi:MAG: CHASE3 domain-containing protein [Bacteroidota bacterium]
MKRSVRNITIVPFLAFAAIVVIFAAATIKLQKDLKSSFQFIYFNGQAEQRLQEVITYLQRAESSRRGYIITQDDLYIESYNEAMSNVFLSLQKVSENNIAEIFNKQYLDSVTTLIQKRVSNINKSFQMYVANKASDSIRVLITNEGRDLNTALRSMVLPLLTQRTYTVEGKYSDLTDSIDHLYIIYFIQIGLLAILAVVQLIVSIKYITRLEQKEEYLSNALARCQSHYDRVKSLLDKTKADDIET